VSATRAAEIFAAALEVEPPRRARLVAEACGGDAALRADVDSLLDADARSGEFLHSPPLARTLAEAATALLDESLEGHTVGAYRLTRRIGAGGMGVVYEAQREGGDLVMRAAVKVLKRGLDTDDVLRRFRVERQILAGLDHPNIARLLDAGALSDGRPAIVMEYVEGEPLHRYADARGLGVDQRLRLFLQVCEAVQYAHQHLVVHRDLKPSNILVTPEGRVKLLDFGVAKMLSPEADVTLTHAPAMTPRYASPEQVRGETVSVATDVYALGVVLHELLVGSSPYGETEGGAALDRAICDTTPAPLSAAAHTRGLAKRLHGDLDNIVLRALRKDPSRRYASVEQFADDITRHLNGLPVIARPDTLRYRTAKFVRRNRLAVAAVTVAALALLTATAVSVMLLVRANAAGREARMQRAAAERVAGFLDDLLGQADPALTARGDAVTVHEVLDRSRVRLETEMKSDPDVAGRLYLTIGQAYLNLGQHAPAESSFGASVRLMDDPEDRVRALGLLATAMHGQGRTDEAERRCREALAQSRSLPARDVGAGARAAFLLARIMTDRGETSRAEEIVRAAMDGLIAAGMTESEEALWAHNALGVVYARSGRLADAEREFGVAVRVAREHYASTHTRSGPPPEQVIWGSATHSAIGDILNRLGTVQARRGAYADAEQSFTRALALHQKVFPTGHPEIAATARRLADARARRPASE
jgi:serine/threonine-protein kinase